MGKIKSVLQYTALCVLIFPTALLPIPYLHEAGLNILFVSVFLTIWSGVDYFYRFQRVFLVAPSSQA
jgi:CDP-diacylglycerol--glycerol-3-phosphate 3-phosphatidyltransferase